MTEKEESQKEYDVSVPDELGEVLDLPDDLDHRESVLLAIFSVFEY